MNATSANLNTKGRLATEPEAEGPSEYAEREAVIVHHLDHSRSQRILWLLEELNLPYVIRRYLRDPATHQAPPELKTVHPLGKSPVISDGDTVVAESGAIIDYLIRRRGAGRLQPDAESAAYDDYIHWLHYAEGSAIVPLIMQPVANAYGRLSTPLKRRVAQELEIHLGYINARLADRHFLLGEELTGADIQLSYVGEVALEHVDCDPYPHLQAWVARFRQRPAYLVAKERGKF